MAGGKLEVQIGADKTDFDKKIKEVEFDIKELSKVKLDRLKVGLDTSEINSQIKDAKASLNSLKTTVKDTGQAFASGLTPKVANGGNALMQFSRIAQDAPYGIIGIGNNITATAEAFSYLKQSTGSTGGALKALGSSIMGTGGLLLGVSLLTTGLTLLSQSGLSVGDIVDKITGDFDALSRSMQKANEEAAKSSGAEIANMKALVSVAQDDTLAREKRLIAVEQLQKQFPSYFANLSTEKILNGDLTNVTRELTAAIVARAKASAYSSEIGKLAGEELTLNNKINNEITSLIKNYQLTTDEAKKFRQEVAKGADAFKLLDPFKKRAGFFDVAGAVLSSNAIKDIRKELINNKAWQDLYTKAIKETTSDSIKLQETETKTSAVKLKKTKFDFKDQANLSKEINTFLSGINYTSPFMQLDIIPDDIGAKARAKLKAVEDALVEFNTNASAIINDSIASTFAGIGEAIGSALAAGGNVLNAIGNSLLSSLGSLLTNMGKMAIQVGVGLLAIKTALQSLNPAVAIGAGVALIALGSFFSSKSASIGGSVGGGGASGASGSGASNSSFTSSGFASRGDGGGTVVFEIAGQKLIGVLSNTINANKRLGGAIGL